MILSLILYMMAAVWGAAVSLLPVATLPPGIPTAIGTVVSWIWVVNPVVDVNTLFLCFGIWLTTEVVLWTADFFFWAYSKLPVIGK